jgi:large subunit ribosomal protein L10
MGSSVSDLESVRKSLRPSKGTFFVVKNSMMNVVLDQLKLESVKPLIDGGVGISLSGDDVIATSKVLVNFSKTHEKFKIKGAVIDGKLIAEDKIKQLASLPTRDVLLAQVARGMKAPITGFVSVLGGVLRKFVYGVNAVKVSKEKRLEAQPTQ